MKMKILTLALSTIFSCSVIANEETVDYAQAGVDYESIVIKFNSEHNKLLIQTIENALTSKFLQREGKESFLSYKDKTKGIDTILNRYFKIQIPDRKSEDYQFINRIIRSLENLDAIEYVYPEARPVPIEESFDSPTATNSNNNYSYNSSSKDYQPIQYYLNAPEDKKNNYAVGGIDAYYAWETAGGDGSGITIIQKEIGQWDDQHEDLPMPVVRFLEADMHQHPTASMGIMGGMRNGYGVTGIAHNAAFGQSAPGTSDFPDMLTYLKPGDVIQVGIHVNRGSIAGCTKKCYQPMESSRIWFDFIKELTDKGVHVIQAAGNGSLNLDHPDFNGKYDRKVRDSGSNIVGAVCAKSGKTAPFSNYGSRIDNSSWGCYDIVTTGYDSLSSEPHANYTRSYSGTSSANPIIAGATASLSGVAKAHSIDLHPKELRQLLVETGTPVGSNQHYIGTQPDLERAIETLLGNVNGENHPPEAIAEAPSIVTHGNDFLLDARHSNDPDGDIITYQWKQIKGQALPMGTDAQKVYLDSSLLKNMDQELGFKLIVSDSIAKSEDSVFIQIKGNIEENETPTPSIETSLNGKSIKINGTKSSDDGVITAYHWTVKDASGSNISVVNAESAEASFTAEVAGEYTVRLSVTDNFSVSSSVEKKLNVSLPDSGTGSCTTNNSDPDADKYPEWNAKTTYTNETVSYNGLIYKAKWWVKGSKPSSSSAWELISQVELPWNKTTAYTGGKEVNWKGVRWQAKWWTKGDEPGKASVWKKIGSSNSNC